MGNKNGTYDTLLEETRELLMQRTGKKICVIIFRRLKFSKCLCHMKYKRLTKIVSFSVY